MEVWQLQLLAPPAGLSLRARSKVIMGDVAITMYIISAAATIFALVTAGILVVELVRGVDVGSSIVQGRNPWLWRCPWRLGRYFVEQKTENTTDLESVY